MSNTLKYVSLAVFGCAFGASFIRYMQHGTPSDVAVLAICAGFIAFIFAKDFEESKKLVKEQLEKQYQEIKQLTDIVHILDTKVSELRTAKTLTNLSQTYPGAGGYTLKR